MHLNTLLDVDLIAVETKDELSILLRPSRRLWGGSDMMRLTDGVAAAP